MQLQVGMAHQREAQMPVTHVIKLEIQPLCRIRSLAKWPMLVWQILHSSSSQFLIPQTITGGKYDRLSM